MSVAPINRFRDQSRFRSSEVTRAFTSAMRAVAEGPQSEVSQPDEVTLEPEVAISDSESSKSSDVSVFSSRACEIAK
jgi:hypothetical protein